MTYNCPARICHKKMKTKQKHSLKNRIICLLAAALVLVMLVLAAASNYLVDYAIGRSGNGGDREVALETETPTAGIEETIAQNRTLQKQKNEDFMASTPQDTVTILSKDGLTLSGVYYSQSSSHKWVLALHGYRGDHRGVVSLAQHYYNNGYQVLTPDLRACGDSQGSFVGMGWLDKEDVLQWIDWILAQDPQAQIVVHGVSMGAATTMMTAGEKIPDNVCVFVEDCGYTSVWDIFSSELQLRFGLPEFPVLYTADWAAQIKAGYGFAEASALKQVAQCEKPMLFIHGTADDFIPYEMMGQLYAAKPGENKQMLTAPGAGHGEAMYALGDTYWQTVFAFIDLYIKD